MLGLARGADIGVHAEHKIHLMIGLVDFDRDFVAHAFIFGVTNHADDLDVQFSARIAAHSDVSPHSEAVLEEPPRELLVDDADFGRAASVRHAEIPAQQDGDVHGLEVIGRNELHVRVGRLGRLVLEAFDSHAAVPFIAGEDRHDG